MAHAASCLPPSFDKYKKLCYNIKKTQKFAHGFLSLEIFLKILEMIKYSKNLSSNILILN